MHGRCAVGFCFVLDMGWRLPDKLRGELLSSMQFPCTDRCDVRLPWFGDCKTNFWDFLHRSPHVFNPRVRCRPVARFVDLLTDGMVDFCLSLNSGKTAQYKHNAQFLRHLGLHGDVNDAHRAGANRLKNKNIHPYIHTFIHSYSAEQAQCRTAEYSA